MKLVHFLLLGLVPLLSTVGVASKPDASVTFYEDLLSHALTNDNNFNHFHTSYGDMSELQIRFDNAINRADDGIQLLPLVFNVLKRLVEVKINQTGDHDAMQCFIDTNLVFKRSRGNNTNNWAKYWTDSRGRRPPGLRQGIMQFIGAPEECTRRGHPPRYDPFLDEILNFDSHFCRMPLRLGGVFPLQFGICLPDTCDGHSVVLIYKAFLDALRDPQLRPYVAGNEVADRYFRVLLNDLDPTKDQRAITDILTGVANALEALIKINDDMKCINEDLVPLTETARYGK